MGVQVGAYTVGVSTCKCRERGMQDKETRQYKPFILESFAFVVGAGVWRSVLFAALMVMVVIVVVPCDAAAQP